MAAPQAQKRTVASAGASINWFRSLHDDLTRTTSLSCCVWHSPLRDHRPHRRCPPAPVCHARAALRSRVPAISNLAHHLDQARAFHTLVHTVCCDGGVTAYRNAAVLPAYVPTLSSPPRRHARILARRQHVRATYGSSLLYVVSVERCVSAFVARTADTHAVLPLPVNCRFALTRTFCLACSNRLVRRCCYLHYQHAVLPLKQRTTACPLPFCTLPSYHLSSSIFVL